MPELPNHTNGTNTANTARRVTRTPYSWYSCHSCNSATPRMARVPGAYFETPIRCSRVSNRLRLTLSFTPPRSYTA